jgi:hypothetical protein
MLARMAEVWPLYSVPLYDRVAAAIRAADLPEPPHG